MPRRPSPLRLRLILTIIPAACVVLSAGQRPDLQVGVPRVLVPRVESPVINPPAAQTGTARRPAQPVTPVSVMASRVVAFADAARQHLDYLPGEVLVKFRDGMTTGQRARALSAVSGRPSADDVEWRSGGVALLRDAAQSNAHVLADQLAAQPEVEWAEPNYIVHLEPLADARQTRTVPATAARIPSWFRTRGVPNDADYSNYQWNFNLISMPSAWDIQPGGASSVIVAVIDTGITTQTTSLTFPLWTGSSIQNVAIPFAVNPDLPAGRLVAPRDFTFLNSAQVLDMDGHGTHVSSTIGEATNNSVLGAGMAYNVRIMPVKVCVGYWEIMIAQAQLGIPGYAPQDAGGCADQDIADGIRYAVDNGARVLNLSLGGPGASFTIRSALTYAVSRGAFVAIAMGNDYDDGNPVEYPARDAADIDGAMSVAAVGKTLARSYYSSTGSYCEIAAPGGDNRTGGGPLDRGYVWQSTLYPPDYSPFLPVPRFDGYDLVGYIGTSMATPHVAGLAALIMSQAPGISPADVERIIRQTAKDLGASGKDDEFGYGLIQPRAALFGYGIRR